MKINALLARFGLFFCTAVVAVSAPPTAIAQYSLCSTALTEQAAFNLISFGLQNLASKMR